MRNFTWEDMKRLTDIEDELCLSLYMPTDPAAAATDADRIRFKNLLRSAEKEIHEKATDKKRLVTMVEKARHLLENDYFWRHQSDGLAVFIAPDVFLFYRLPESFLEQLAGARRFHVKPLLPLFMADGRFYVLALSQNRIRLFDCTRHNVMEIDLVDVPEGIDQTLNYDSKQYQLQFHTGAAEGGGKRPAMFHGHGVSVDDNKDEILRYFQKVGRGLADILREPHPPLVLAGVEYLTVLFREATSFRRVMPDIVGGNPEHLRPEQLHASAWKIVRPELERDLRSARERYRELVGKGYTAAGVRAVVPAAAFGQVETLFVALDEKRLGTFDPHRNEVAVYEPHATEGEDLLDLAAVQTIRNGGKVYAVDSDKMPQTDAAAAAILRY